MDFREILGYFQDLDIPAATVSDIRIIRKCRHQRVKRTKGQDDCKDKDSNAVLGDCSIEY